MAPLVVEAIGGCGFLHRALPCALADDPYRALKTPPK